MGNNGEAGCKRQGNRESQMGVTPCIDKSLTNSTIEPFRPVPITAGKKVSSGLFILFSAQGEAALVGRGCRKYQVLVVFSPHHKHLSSCPHRAVSSFLQVRSVNYSTRQINVFAPGKQAPGSTKVLKLIYFYWKTRKVSF